MKKYKIKQIDFTKDGKTINCDIIYFIGKERNISNDIAVCSNEDSFDEIKGIRIAESRAKIIMFREILISINKELDNEIEYVCTFEGRKRSFIKVIPQLSFEYLKYYKCLKKEERHLKKLIFN